MPQKLMEMRIDSPPSARYSPKSRRDEFPAYATLGLSNRRTAARYSMTFSA